jgi:hypothetical protein
MYQGIFEVPQNRMFPLGDRVNISKRGTSVKLVHDLNNKFYTEVFYKSK